MPSGKTRAFAVAALVVGALFAGMSVYWGLGGSRLVDTVGGGLAAQGYARSAVAVVLVWGAAIVKTVASALPWVAVTRSPASAWRRPLRALTWLEAVILVTYGGLLTAVGLLVQADVIRADADADQLALRWHAYLWDPWFLIWGLLVVAALLTSRPDASRWPRASATGAL
jgi:hypothetical protein